MLFLFKLKDLLTLSRKCQKLLGFVVIPLFAEEWTREGLSVHKSVHAFQRVVLGSSTFDLWCRSGRWAVSSQRGFYQNVMHYNKAYRSNAMFKYITFCAIFSTAVCPSG